MWILGVANAGSLEWVGGARAQLEAAGGAGGVAADWRDCVSATGDDAAV